MNTMEPRAQRFATLAHARDNQRRKYTGEPYINHPAAVAELVRSVPHTDGMLCAAWLHDVVEDCAISIEEIQSIFGYFIAELVFMLTDVSKPRDGNRAIRKLIDRVHTAHASVDAKTIKLADLIDNSRSIVAHDPDFARVYMAEKALLLEVLREGDATLWHKAKDIIDDYMRTAS